MAKKYWEGQVITGLIIIGIFAAFWLLVKLWNLIFK